MPKFHFYEDEVKIGEAELPDTPRIGEAVFLKYKEGAALYTVRMVLWDAVGDGQGNHHIILKWNRRIR